MRVYEHIKYIHLNTHAHVHVPQLDLQEHMHCLCACMIMVRIIIANYATLYTVDIRPRPSETKEHKVFRAPFTLILQLGIPKISGAVPPALF